MSPPKLSDRDIEQLADHLLTQFVRRDTLGDPRGRQIHQKDCAVCHGDRGQGAVWAAADMTRPPRNFAAGPGLDRETMIVAVRDGRPGTAMAGFGSKLASGDIAPVVGFIRTALIPASISGTRAHGGRESDTVSAPAGVDLKAQFPNGLKGDARRGSTHYLANCATCHGTRGDGDRPRAFFINPKPRNFVEPSARARTRLSATQKRGEALCAINCAFGHAADGTGKNWIGRFTEPPARDLASLSAATFPRPRLVSTIRNGLTGTSMPAWRDALRGDEIDAIVDYVVRAFFRTETARADSAGINPNSTPSELHRSMAAQPLLSLRWSPTDAARVR